MKPPTFDDKNWTPVPRVPEWPVYQPESLPADWKLVTDYYENRAGEEYKWLFYYDQRMLIIYNYCDTLSRFSGKPIRHIEQYEFPIQGARWFVENIKRFFIKPGEPGALPTHKFSLSEYCGEEKLGISRLVHTYTGTPGYTLNNLSRCEHPDMDLCQMFEMCDDALFKSGGYLDVFTSIAERYERGELQVDP